MIFETDLTFLSRDDAYEMQQILKDILNCPSKITRKPLRTREFEYSGTLKQFRYLADNIEESILTYPEEDHELVTAAVDHIRTFTAEKEKHLREFFKTHNLCDVFDNPKLDVTTTNPFDADGEKLNIAEMKAYADRYMLYSVLEENGVLAAGEDGVFFQYVKEKPVEEIILRDNGIFLGCLNPDHIEESGMKISMYVAAGSKYILTIGAELIAVEPEQFLDLLDGIQGLFMGEEEMDELCDTLHENRMMALGILELIHDGKNRPAAIAEGMKTVIKEKFHVAFDMSQENMKDALDDLKKAKIVREKNGVYILTADLPE